MSFITIGLGVAIDALRNAAPAGGQAITKDEFAGLWVDMTDVLTALKDVMDNAEHQASSAVTQAKDARIDIRHVGNDVKLITEHTYDVVIPNSLAWVEGDINRRILKPLRNRLASFKRQIDFLMGWRGQIIFWRNKFVDPTLNRYVAFEKYFNGTSGNRTSPRLAIGTLIGWLANSDYFASFIMPAISQPISAWYAQRSHQQDLDALLSVIIDNSPDRYRHIIAAMDQVLDSPYP